MQPCLALERLKAQKYNSLSFLKAEKGFLSLYSVYVVVALRLSSSRVSAVVVVDRGSPDCACVRHAARAAPPPPCDGTPAPAGLVSLCTAARCTRPPLLLSQVSQVTCKCNATTHYYDYPKAPLTTNLMIVVFEN